MPTKPKRRRGLSPAHAAARRKARERLSERDRALQQWLTLQLAGDAATAHLVWWVGTLHAGLMAWTHDAVDAHALPAGGAASVSGTPDPDQAMLRALAENVEAADLETVRSQVAGKLAELVGWYTTHLRTTPPWPDAQVLHWLATWTGDLEVAQKLERCLCYHAALKRTGEASRRKAAEARWRRLAAWYVRLLDGRNTRCDLT